MEIIVTILAVLFVMYVLGKIQNNQRQEEFRRQEEEEKREQEKAMKLEAIEKVKNVSDDPVLNSWGGDVYVQFPKMLLYVARQICSLNWDNRENTIRYDLMEQRYSSRFDKDGYFIKNFRITSEWINEQVERVLNRVNGSKDFELFSDLRSTLEKFGINLDEELYSMNPENVNEKLHSLVERIEAKQKEIIFNQSFPPHIENRLKTLYQNYLALKE